MADAAADADEKMASERVGRSLGGKWKLERLLGVGGMAAVYSARDSEGQLAALKVLHPEMSRRSDIRQRFAQEGMAATRVGHPGVVAVLGNGEEPDGTAYLILELLEGDTLSDVLRRDETLPLPRLLDILDQVLDVLAAAHERGIVHRDLKPDNLFVTRDGRVKVLDFGIARVLDDLPGAYKTRTGITLGTVPFMSPEQALGKRAQVDGRSDLFSLGAMMFRILAGRHVHTAETDAELLVAMASKPAPSLASVAPSCPPGLSAVVDLALAFSKDARYPDARTMQSDLRAVKEGAAPPFASRARASREMATRTDIQAPVVSFVANRAGATVPEATAATRPDSAGPGAPALTERETRLAGGPLPVRTVPASPSFTVPDTQAPASFRGVDLPKPATAIAAATTVENPAFAAPTLKMAAPPDGRTLTSTPPPKKGASRLGAAVAGAVGLTVVLGGGYAFLSRQGTEPAASPGADSSATPVVATATESPPGGPPATAIDTGTPASPAAAGATPSYPHPSPTKPGAAPAVATNTAAQAPTGASPTTTTATPSPNPTAAPSPTTAPAPSPGPTNAPPPNPTASPPPGPTNTAPTATAKPPAPPSPTQPAPAPTPTTSSKAWTHGHKPHH